ncbi:hypothetical protein BDR07DRAFT_1283553 [Suillus spraguei]|nr:hypothetical protein BDR07DRAFT_1283553 [Suillus spraguei]
MNTLELNTTSSVTPDSDSASVPQLSSYNDCMACRIIGSGAFAATGIYALRMARPSAPGSIVGKRIMGGLGVCFLAGSALRWRM